MRNLKFCAVLLLAALSAFVFPAHANDIRYQARIAALYPISPNGEPIRIQEFGGQDGAEFTVVLEAALGSATLCKDQNGVDCEKLLTVNSGSPAVIMQGDVLDSSVYNQNYTKEDRYCSASSGLFKCEQYSTRTLSCQKVTGSYAVRWKATQLAGGKKTSFQNVKYQGEYSVCEGKMQGGLLGLGGGAQFSGDPLRTGFVGDVSSPSELLGALRGMAAERVRELVAPYNKAVKVKFMDGSGGVAKDSRATYNSAMVFAKAARLDRACSMLKELYNSEENQSSVTLNYNLGVCDEAMLPDDPSRAYEYYNKADQLSTKPIKMISNALDRIGALVRQSNGID
jgi:hypothetical protein